MDVAFIDDVVVDVVVDINTDIVVDVVIVSDVFFCCFC